MNDQVIIAVANAITANAEVLKALVEQLPKADQKKVTEKVSKVTPTTAPAAILEPVSVAVATPTVTTVVETVTQPITVSTTPTVPTMPAAPFPNVAAPVATPPAPTLISETKIAFTDHKGMVTWVMDSYQRLGPDRGKNIQNVLNSLGVHNINDVKPEQYVALVQGVEAL